jgi:hypothetical protein
MFVTSPTPTLPHRADWGRYVLGTLRTLRALSLSLRERGRNTDPCQSIEGEGKSEELGLPRLRESQQFLRRRLTIQVDHPAILDDGC